MRRLRPGSVRPMASRNSVALGGFELGDLGFEAPQMRTTWTSLFGGALFYGVGVGVAGR